MEVNGQVLHESLPRGSSACAVSLSGRTLVARLPNGEVMKMDLRRAEFHRGGAGGSQFVYASTVLGGPTFVTEDAELHRAVNLAWSSAHARAQPRSAGSGKRHLPHSQKLALGILASLLALVVVAFLMVGPLVRVTLRFVPRSVDSRLGQEAYPHILKQVGFGSGAVEQDSIREPVQAVLDRLSAAVPNNPFFFRVAVCRSPMVNAFALPGGQIIVTTGLLGSLESGEELAAVLAHEMNHVLFRHAMQMTIRASGLRFLAYALSRDHPVAGVATAVWSAVGLMSMSRDKESQADREAVRLLADASIDPKVMVPTLGRLAPAELRPARGAQASAGGSLFEKLRSHPETGQRIADVEAAIASISPVVAPQPLDIDYGALLEAVGALEAAPMPRSSLGGMASWDR
jgi:Zn-dependent protease with chaperone function